MSVSRTASGPAVAAFAATASLLLASRAVLPPVAGAARPALGVVLFGGLLAASLLVPTVREPDAPAATSRPTVIAVGLAAAVAAALVVGRPAPAPFAAWTLPLSVLAAVAEEACFRRVVYGRLRRWGPVVAVVGAAALFAVLHLPLYGAAALPVDLGAGLVFGWQRWASGTWAVPAGTHVAANVLAVLR